MRYSLIITSLKRNNANLIGDREMKTFKNTKADLNADATVAVYAQTEERNALLGDNWVETNEEVTYESLYVQAGVRFFGIL